MDGICDSVNSIQQAKRLTNELDEVLMKVKECLSNQSLENEIVGQEKPELKVLRGATQEKILGTVWDHAKDMLLFNVNPPNYITLTQRIVLSQISRIFDPLPFAAAFLLRAKIGMQHLWQRGLDWHQELPPAAQEEWSCFYQEMGDLNHVTFERSLTPEDSQYSLSFLMHPTKPLELLPTSHGEPKAMKLQEAALATRLSQSIAEESRVQFEKVVFFSNSNIVLSWIRSQAREFKQFVSAQVAEIRNNSDPSQWRHVPGELNIADDISRGILAQRLNGRWKPRPEFSRMPEDEWPQENSTADLNEVEKERRKTQAILLTSSSEVIHSKKFPNWRKLVRTSTYGFRFIRNLRCRCQAKKLPKNPEEQMQGSHGPLAPQELEKAEKYWVKQSQKTLQGRLKKGELQQLSPFTDKNGIIRVDGPVDKALVSYETKHPAMLPQDHWISLLITRHFHQIGHAGVGL
ncbi:uncharacterized protein [Acropora muricata]|uniref:uncharacterized protein n=1 Tax=Acropora muricata TaxID=159855 RepID=UPI0034E5DAE8